MSQAVVQFILGRAVTDSRFREALWRSREIALAGYDLTPEEYNALRKMNLHYVEMLAVTLDERISR